MKGREFPDASSAGVDGPGAPAITVLYGLDTMRRHGDRLQVSDVGVGSFMVCRAGPTWMPCIQVEQAFVSCHRTEIRQHRTETLTLETMTLSASVCWLHQSRAVGCEGVGCSRDRWKENCKDGPMSVVVTILNRKYFRSVYYFRTLVASRSNSTERK